MAVKWLSGLRQVSRGCVLLVSDLKQGVYHGYVSDQLYICGYVMFSGPRPGVYMWLSLLVFKP